MSDEPPAVRVLPFTLGEAIIVRCARCGVYASGLSDAQLAGEAPIACPSFLCRAETQQDWRPAIAAAHRKEP